MAKSMNGDLSEAVEKLGTFGGMNEAQAQTWLARTAAAQIEKAQQRARKSLSIGPAARAGRRAASSAPRRYRGNKKLATAASSAG